MEGGDEQAEGDEEAQAESGEKGPVMQIFRPALCNGKKDEGRQSQIDEKLVERGLTERGYELEALCQHAQKKQNEHRREQEKDIPNRHDE